MMKKYRIQRIDAIWLVLLAATGLTWWLGEHPDATMGTFMACVVLALSGIKGCLIVLDYMELRHAPALWRRLLLGWLAFTLVLVLSATLWHG